MAPSPVRAATIVGAGPSSARAATAAPIGGLPAYSHVVVLVLENESASTTFGAGSPAKYLNALVNQSAFDINYFGTGHASLDNYIAMVSGQPDQPLSASDCAPVNLYLCVQPQTAMAGGRNLADQLETAGVSWKGYMDGMPSPCFHADYSPTAAPPDPYQGNSSAAPAYNYADRHNPFLYFDDIISNDARCKAHVLPYPQLATDIAHDAVPQFSFITPDTCHDGHDAPCANGAPGGLTSADLWLTQQVPQLLTYLQAHNGLLLITFDEGAATSTVGCCSGGAGGTSGVGGQVGLLALGPHTRVGQKVSTSYDHASLLRTLEQLFGITEYLNNAASSTAMTDLFLPASAGTGTGASGSSASGAGSGSTSATGTGLANTSAARGGALAAGLAACAVGLTLLLTVRLRRRRDGGSR